MGNMTATSALSVNIQGDYDRNLLNRLTPNLVFLGWGQERPMKKRSGTQITFRRFANLSNATTALTEGVTPAGSALSKTDYQATLAQYGDYCTITDWVDMVALDATLLEAGRILGDQAASTLDVICRDVLVAGTSVEYASAVTSRATVDAVVTAGDLQKASNFLERNNVKTLKKKIVAGTAVGTTGIMPRYIGICHMDLRKDLEAITGFQKVANYPSQASVMEGEIGTYMNIAFIGTSNGKIWSGGGATGTTFRNDGTDNNVYGIVIFGEDAYGNSRIGKELVKNIIKPLGAGEDPLDQRATSGWKANYVAKILSDLRVVRVEVACTDLSLDTAATSE